MTALTVTVLGVPVGQGRVSGGGMRQTKTGRLYHQPAYHSNRAELDPWRDKIAGQVREEMAAQGVEQFPKTEPVELHATFSLARPPSVPPSKRWAPTVAPDLDHYLRALGDALTGALLEDDAQIVTLRVSKVYAVPPALPGVTFTVAPAERGTAVAA